jgi:hypothetical protein
MLTGAYDGDANYAQISETNLADWKETITELGALQGVDVVFTDESVVSVYQESPWFVTFTWNVDVEFVDSLSDSIWEERISAETAIPVARFYDPLHNVDGRAKINVVQADDVDPESVLDENTFVVNTNAPSFLQRLEGPPFNNADGYGIETLVDVAFYKNVQDIDSSSNSAQDWLYFSGENVEEGEACLLEEQSEEAYISGQQCAAYDLDADVIYSPQVG